MLVKTNRNSKLKNLWGVNLLIRTQNIGSNYILDTNEYLVDVEEARALISPKPMMSLERLASLDVDRYFQLPRQLYELLMWSKENGEKSKKFKEVEQLPICSHEECTRFGPFVCKVQKERAAFCVDHAQSFKPVECLFVKENN